jgi:hypothetical protein
MNIQSFLHVAVVAIAGEPAAHDLGLDRPARKRKARHPIRSRCRWMRCHHPRLPHKIGAAGVGGEMSYHAAELAGWHTGVALSAALLLAVVVLRIAFQLRA